MRKGQSIVVHHTGNYYTASCKMVFRPPAACQAPPVAGVRRPQLLRQTIALRPAPCRRWRTPHILVVETLKLYSKRTEFIVALYSGPTGEEKKHFNPCRPRKKQDDEKPTHKMRKCLSTTKMLARSFEDEKSSSLMSSSTMIYTMRKLSHYY